MNKRTFIFGSEWLYIKIYSGPKTLEDIFVNEIAPELNKLLEEQSIDYYFFIRYQDPQYHMRLRLHLCDVRKIGNIIIFLNKIFEPYISDHIISNLTISIYNREIERYGEKFIEDIERIFSYDSFFIINYLRNNNLDDSQRYLVSMKYIDFLLNRCGFSIDDKIRLCELNSTAYSNELYANLSQVNKQLNLKYRTIRNAITAILNKNYMSGNWIDELNQYLDNITFFTNRYSNLESGIKISNFYSLLTSLIHMHINRMFRTRQRVNECVIYYMLLKFYRSENAKQICEKANNT